jgi:hypothetical protein
MYSTVFPALFFGHIATVFFSGMPSDAAGPVAETVTPILICDCAAPVNVSVAAAKPQMMVLFIEPPRCCGRSGAIIAEARRPAGSALRLDA